jgi:2-polyprenyl-3-methyl-5-hydroxy-6-metoxy-1,4-benzoquinol methylase
VDVGLSPRRLGFVIEEFLELQGWRPLAIDGTVPLIEVAACPADGMSLGTLCTLFDRSGNQQIRIGCCPRCGHVTYIDRPTKDWVDEYYLSSWDSHNLESRMDRRQRHLSAKLPGEKTGVRIALGLDINRSRPVCEIGCGYGANMQHLANAGFSHVVGTEASEHRAAVVRQVFGFDVFTAPFESEETQGALARRAPFSLIYSHHVLEHTYHPDLVIGAASRLQGAGDYLIVSVPNHEQEPSMGVLLFMPHIHSFTRASMQTLAARFGYELVDDSHMHPKNVNLAFRKVQHAPAPPPAEDLLASAVEKYVHTLHLKSWFPGRRRLWWSRRADKAGQTWMLWNPRLDARHWDAVVRRHGYELHRSAMITNLRKRRTSVDESPLEIQFSGELNLLLK